MPLFETSAKDDSRSDHVEAIFMTLAHKIKKQTGASGPLLNSRSQNGPSGGRRIVYQNEAYQTPNSHLDGGDASDGACCG